MRGEKNEGPLVWSGIEVSPFWWVWAVSIGMEIEPRLLSSLFCREGSFPRVDRVISACGGKGTGRRERREREHMDAPVLPKPRSIFSWGLSLSGALESGVRWGAFCANERWTDSCLHTEGLTAVTLRAYIFLPSDVCTWADVPTQTQTP